jgi:protocatechuate 3,4-dioxygenase beta subunit
MVRRMADEHDRGLAYDLPILLSRRRALAAMGAAGLSLALAACGDGSSGSGTAASSGSGAIAEETAGPFPADGSNGVDVLTQSGIVRSDITRSFGDASGVAAGVPLTFELTVLDTANGSAPLAGAAVYLWHCASDGAYSLYAGSAQAENFLRGVQAGDESGVVRFTSVYPGAYSGRWPHAHFEVYPSLESATSGASKLRTSQLALPEEASTEVYATSGYEGSAANLAGSSLDTDMVFADGYSLQLATVTGSVQDGLTTSLRVPV